MKDVQEVVLRLHTELMHSRGIDKVSSPDLEIRPRNGITSESIVFLLLNIEEELGIELDDYLAKIRVSKTIEALIDVVRQACEDQQ